MSGLSPQLKKICSLTLAAFALWLGGFGCALCCATMVTKDCCADEEFHAATAALSFAESEHACCQMADETSPSQGAAISKRASLKSCVLLPTDKTNLALIPQFFTDVHTGSTFDEPFLLQPVALEIRPVAIDTSPPGRSDTYLRCCVLLI